MSGKRPISHRRFYCYLAIVMLLFAGGLYGVWRTLHNRDEQTAAIVQYTVTTDLANTVVSKVVTEDKMIITTERIADGTILQDDLGASSVGLTHLDPEVIDWVRGTQVVAPGTLLTPQIIEALRQLLGLSLEAVDSLGLLDDLIAVDQVVNGAVGLLRLADNTVNSLSILDGSIGVNDLNNTVIDAFNVVGTLVSGSITSLEIADGSIDVVDLNSALATTLGAIGTIAGDSITSLHIVDGAIDTIDLALGSVTGSVVANGAIGTLQIATDAVTSVIIADGTIATDDVQLGAITGGLIANGTIQLSNLDAAIVNALSLIGSVSDNAVTTLKIADGTIGLADLDPVLSDALALIGTVPDGSITSLKILNGTIDSVDIADGAIGLLQLANDAVDGSILASGSVSISHLDAALSALLAQIGVIADNSITSAKIVNGTIEAEDIVSGAIGTLQLGNGVVTAGKLSTAANTRTVSVLVGSLSLTLGSRDYPVFVAPSSGTVTKITLTNEAAVSVSTTATVFKNNVSAVASTNLNIISSGLTPYSLTLTGNTSFTAGDIYSLRINGALGLSLSGFLVTIEYVPSE